MRMPKSYQYVLVFLVAQEAVLERLPRLEGQMVEKKWNKSHFTVVTSLLTIKAGKLLSLLPVGC